MSQMYDWVAGTWNPLAGECQHKCSYCYVKSLRRRMPNIERKYSGPHRIELPKTPPKKGEVFLCSMNDLFEDSVTDGQIREILRYAERYSHQTRWVIQTKDPRRLHFYSDIFSDFGYLPIFGTTIESNRNYEHRYAPMARERADGLKWASSIGYRTFVTVEPIMDFDLSELLEIIDISGAHYINIGADSKGSGLPEPPEYKIRHLIDQLECRDYEVRIKGNLKRLMPNGVNEDG